ncbi:MAG: tetratricopeptide repeat protein [Chloroflexota bacterium]
MAELPSGVFTFLATDIEGSVELWQRNEVAMSVALARHDRILRETVLLYGGRVVKGSGDGIWAVFARPTPAFDAALAIQAAMRATVWGEPGELRVRVAIHAGAAELRDGDYYGSTPNRLARLVERVRGRQILVSEATVTLAGPEATTRFTLRAIGELRLRNMREPLRAFELASPGSDDDDSEDDSDSGVASFVPSYAFPRPGRLVGRSPELDALWAAVERGRESAQVILIAAPAGIGKSTLTGELVRRARSLGALCLAGGAYEQGGAMLLGPLHEALADFLLSQPVERLDALLDTVLDDLALVVPELTYHLHRPRQADGPPDLDRLSGAVFMCLLRLAARHPILLCLEDLHIADDATLRLLRQLTRRAGRLPLVLCLTFRADEIPAGSELERLVAALTREGATRVDPSPLDRDETGQLIASLLDGPASERLRDSLYATTEGNPLFLEQTVLALREQGQIGRAGRVWHGASDAEVSLPTIVRDVLEQRLERLSQRCAGTVAMAAVLGQTFELDALSGAVGSPPILGVIEDLEEALRARVLREVPSGYAFTHALLREAAYGKLSAPRRIWMHARAGEALERLAGSRASDRAAELAYHFYASRAGADSRDKALRYSLEAGRRAAALMLHREALRHFANVCDLIDRDGATVSQMTHLDVLDGRQNAERSLGLWRPLIETCERILSLADDPIKRARAHSSIGHAWQRVGDMVAAERACDDTLRDLEGLPATREVTVMRLQVSADKSYLLFLQGRYDEQAEIGDAMLPVARELGLPEPLWRTHNVIATAAQGRGQLDRARKHFTAYLASAIEMGDPLSQALAHSNLGILHQYAGSFVDARVQLERALELRREAGAEQRDVNTLQRLGWVCLGEGDLAGAFELGARALDLATRASDRWASDCHDLLGTIASLHADWPTATAHFEAALQLRKHGPHVVGRVQTRLGFGMVRQRTGDWPGARTLYADALAIASSISPSPWLVAARRQLGLLLCQAGERDGLELVRAALELAETMPLSIQFAPTLLAAVEAGLYGDDRAAAVCAVERALASGLTVEVQVELLCTLARLLADGGDLEAAEQQLVPARILTIRLGAVRTRCLLSEAEGVLAAVRGDTGSAAVAFDQALAVAREAGLPYEQARLLAASGATEAFDSARREAMLAEARVLLRNLSSA